MLRRIVQPVRPAFMGILLLATLLASACGSGSDAPQPLELTRVRPPMAIAGVPAALTLVGSGFSAATSVTVAGQKLADNMINANTLTVQVPASDLAQPGAVTVAAGAATLSLPVAAPGTVGTTANPQVARLTFTSPVAAQLAVQFGPDTSYGLATWQRAVTAGGTVSMLVAGMLADSAYHLRVVLTFPDNSQLTGPDHAFSTGAPPPGSLPAMGTPSPASGAPGGGVEMLNFYAPVVTAPVVVTDTSGRVMWYYQLHETDLELTPSQLGPDGNVYLLLEAPQTYIVHDRSASGVREVDLAGDALHELRVPQINAELAAAGADFSVAGFSHDLLPLPAGHVVLLAEVYKTFTDLACCEGISTTLVGPGIVDLDAQWQVDWFWNGFDHLDPNRIVNGFGPYPPDWTHANALLYTADHDLLLSLRHQSWILKIAYADGQGSGDVLWKLGWQGDFTLARGGPSQWFYGQHGPEILADNGHQMTLAVFDDGNYRVLDASASPPVQCGIGAGPACYSRGVIYQINQEARTAQVVWQFLPGMFSFWGGDIRRLLDGDMEIALSAGAPPNPLADSMDFEVTHTTPPTIVWRFPDGAFAYRAFRLPSLYPGVTWRTVP